MNLKKKNLSKIKSLYQYLHKFMELLIIILLIISKQGWYQRNKDRILAKAKKDNNKSGLIDIIKIQANEIKDLKEELQILKDQMKENDK